jgi:quinol monooxygenase YgiN
MIIVAGYLLVDPADRDTYLADCVGVLTQARSTRGCLDFCQSPDLLDPSRINIFELWDSQEAVEAFRGSGPSGEQQSAIQGASVSEYDIAETRLLT